MERLIYKIFKKLDISITANDLAMAEAMLRELHEANLSSNARKLFVFQYQRFLKIGGADIELNKTVTTQAISPEHPEGQLSSFDARVLLDGISLVTCCMNRNDNLRTSLISWLKLPVQEIVIVDWNSAEPVISTIGDIVDNRVRIIRVENEPKWILTYAFNVGLRFASYKKIYKLDADIQVQDDFIELNHFNEGEFIRGSWKSAVDDGKADQVYINGSFGCSKADLLAIGLYNEFIRSYGWDDSDLYERLASVRSLKQRFLIAGSIFHLDQEEHERIENQAIIQTNFLGLVPSTEFNNQVNKYLVRLYDNWRPDLLQDYSIESTGTNAWLCRRITKTQPIPQYVMEDAQSYAALTWITNSRPDIFKNTTNKKEFSRILYADYSKKISTDEVLTLLGVYDLAHELCVYRDGSDSIIDLINNSSRNNKNPLYILATGTEAQRFEIKINKRLVIVRVEIEQVCLFILKHREVLLGYEEPYLSKIAPGMLTNIDSLKSTIGLIKHDVLSRKISKIRKKRIYIDVQHGLGNRLRALASAATIAKNLNRELVLIWEPDHHCDCRFSDLYDYAGKVIEKSFINDITNNDIDLYNYMELEANAVKDEIINIGENDIYFRSAYVLNSELSSWEEENEFLQSLSPSVVINKLVSSINVDNRLGAHVRMEAGKGLDNNTYDALENWSQESHTQIQHWREKSHFSHFITHIDQLPDHNMGIFLATDLTETYASFSEYYGDRLVYLKRSAYDRSTVQIQYALADCILLSKCSRFLGSTWSSFSELAIRLTSKHQLFEMSGEDF